MRLRHWLLAAWLLVATLAASVAPAAAQIRGFQATGTTTLAVPATPSSANVALPNNAPSVLVWNVGQFGAFAQLGGSGIAATTSSVFIPAGCGMVFQTTAAQFLAGTGSGGPTTFVVTQGFGEAGLVCTSHDQMSWSTAHQAALAGLLGGGVKNSAAGVLGSLYCYNSNATVAFVQVFDVATSGGVTLGTTTAKFTVPIPATSAYGVNFSLAGAQFLNGIQIATTTTDGGSTAPGAGLSCTESWN